MAIQKEQLNKVIPASFSAEEILSCLEEDGIIDTDSARDIIQTQSSYNTRQRWKMENKNR